MIARAALTAGALLGAALLAGCSANSAHPGDAASTSTATATASPAPTATVTETARPTPTDSPSAVAGGTRCTVADLAGAIGERNGEPAGTGEGMNQQHVAIILTNTSGTTCTLQGWPGVSLVGDGNGTQLGAAATLDRSDPHPTVTIAPGQKVQAPIDYTDAAVYPTSQCTPKTADGLRVYPPGSTQSLFIVEKWDACTSTQHVLMTVGAFVTYP